MCANIVYYTSVSVEEAVEALITHLQLAGGAYNRYALAHYDYTAMARCMDTIRARLSEDNQSRSIVVLELDSRRSYERRCNHYVSLFLCMSGVTVLVHNQGGANRLDRQLFECIERNDVEQWRSIDAGDLLNDGSGGASFGTEMDVATDPRLKVRDVHPSADNSGNTLMMTPTLRRAYRRLGLPVSARREAVRRRWHQLSLRSHPDKSSGKSEDDFVAITDAYTLIMHSVIP